MTTPAPVSVQVGGNVDGSIVIGNHNFVVNTNHGTIVYQQAAPQVRRRTFTPQPPRAPRGFVDRVTELNQLETWIAAKEIVLLHAPDGLGKSALLRQAANGAAAKALPDGVLLLESLDADSQTLGPEDVLQRLFDALFESNPPLKVEAATARTYLSNTRPLVLLDEIPLSPALLQLLPDLFPQGALLLTADLGTSGDLQRLALGPLPRDEAIRLLAEKAGLVVDETRATLDGICALLDDVPLAVSLIANLLRETHLPPEACLAALGAESVSTRDPVSAGLDRAFLLVFDKLSPDERQVLAAAALTPGVSMTPDWLAAALGSADVTPFVERLQALGLLFTNSPRLRLPPGMRLMVRQRAIELLDEDALLSRLAEYLASEFKRHPLDWAIIGGELGNAFGALSWAVRAGEWTEVAALGRALDPYLSLHGLWNAWGRVLDYLLTAARNAGERALEAWALHQLGTRLIGLGNPPGASDLLRQALDIRQSLGDSTGAAFTRHNLALLSAPPVEPPHPKGRLPRLLLGGFSLALVAAAVVMLLFSPVSPLHPPPTKTLTPTTTPTSSVTPTFTPTITATLTATSTASLTPTLTPAISSLYATPDPAYYGGAPEFCDSHVEFHVDLAGKPQVKWVYVQYVYRPKPPLDVILVGPTATIQPYTVGLQLVSGSEYVGTIDTNNPKQPASRWLGQSSGWIEWSAIVVYESGGASTPVPGPTDPLEYGCPSIP